MSAAKMAVSMREWRHSRDVAARGARAVGRANAAHRGRNAFRQGR